MFKNKKFELIYSTCTGSRTLPYIVAYKNFQFIKIDLSVQYITVRYNTDTNLFNLIFFQKIDTMVLRTWVQHRTEILPINHCSCMHFLIFLLNFVCMYTWTYVYVRTYWISFYFHSSLPTKLTRLARKRASIFKCIRCSVVIYEMTPQFKEIVIIKMFVVYNTDTQLHITLNTLYYFTITKMRIDAFWK